MRIKTLFTYKIRRSCSNIPLSEVFLTSTMLTIGIMSTHITVRCCCFVFLFFKHSTFAGSAWSFGFFIPATTANNLRLRRISIPDIIHYSIFLSYFLRKSQYFHFYNVFGMTRSLTGDWTRDLPHSKPALYH